MKIIPIILAGLVVVCGCSIRRLAVNQFGDALAKGGGVFESDDDPELVPLQLLTGEQLKNLVAADLPPASKPETGSPPTASGGARPMD